MVLLKQQNMNENKTRRRIFGVIIAPMGASLIESMAFSLIKPVACSLINALSGKGNMRAGKGQEVLLLPLFSLPLMIKAMSG